MTSTRPQALRSPATAGVPDATADRRRTRRRRRVALASTVSIAVVVGGASTGASRSAPGLVCTWRPIADGVDAGPALIGTVRVRDGDVEVLHRAACSDGSVHDAWFGPP